MEEGGRAGGSGSRSQSQPQSQSQFGVSPPEISTPPLTVEAISDSQQVEAASPISSRPPAPSSLNYEELMRLSGASAGGVQMAADDDALAAAAGEEADRSGGGVGNRWPRQETLALLKIRSDMDAAFRDATLKGPLWEEVSRKLAELGYRRSAKKCKEKFENVQKYYKRTKEGRGGRQDGKTYKFFSQLEALHSAGTNTSNPGSSAPTNVAASFSVPATTVGITYPRNVASSQVATPVSVGIGISNPTPISSVKISPTISATPSQNPTGIFSPADHFSLRAALAAPAVSGSAAATANIAQQLVGVSFSSNSSSSSTGSEDNNDEDEEFDGDLEGEPSNIAGTSRKRRRGSSKGTGSRTHRMMMEFFENLMKQVMHKQEVMQQRFLDAIEKREQDRMIREETWKRQEMARLTREQERMAQERAIAASRDAAIIAFLQKFTGQTIQLPQPVNISSAPPPHDVPVPPSPVPPTPTPPPPATQPPQSQIDLLQQKKQYHVHDHQSPNVEVRLPANTLPLVMPVPLEPRLPYQESNMGDGSSEATSSRWPKPEVLALIKLRGGLEARYQDTGPKGPLWEEISAGMQRMGYKRSAKRCKEKWENINKYFKKVKESHKKRREDSKTCPYFHELDALYRKKILGGSDGSASRSTFSDTSKLEQDLHLQQENINRDIAPSTVIPVGSDADAHSSMPQAQAEKTLASGSGSAVVQTCDPGSLSASLFGEGTEEAATKPEDIVNELMELQDLYRQERPQLTVNEYDIVEEPSNNDVDQEDDEEDDCCSEDKPEKRNIDYKIEFQRRNVANSNNVGSEFPSMAVVQ